MIKRSIVCLFLFVLVGLSQNTRTTPLDNVIFKTDVNANNKNITNVSSVVFIENGTNLSINLSYLLNLMAGSSYRLVDRENLVSHLIVSNSRPYLITSNSTREVTLNNDTSYVRQYDPHAYITNATIYGELKIESVLGVDDSDYSVTQRAITNGTLQVIRIGNFFIREVDGVLEAVNLATEDVTELTPRTP